MGMLECRIVILPVQHQRGRFGKIIKGKMIFSSRKKDQEKGKSKLGRIEESGAVVDGENFHRIGLNPVHEAVAAHNNFTEGGLVGFGNNPSALRECFHSFQCLENIGNKKGRVMGRIKCDKLSDGPKVVSGLPCSSYFIHFAILSFTAEWGRVCPASACWRPFSIFPRKKMRSIASSMEALSGRSFTVRSTLSLTVIGKEYVFDGSIQEPFFRQGERK